MNATAAPQQDLHPFIVYDHIPTGCIPFPVTDDSTAPLLRPGELVLVDTTDREPTHRDLFVIRWLRGEAALVELFLVPGQYGSGPNGETVEGFCWFVGAYNRPRGHEQMLAWSKAGRIVRFCDGPYVAEGPGAHYLKSKLVGRVVGILEASSEELQRLGRDARQ